MSVVTPTKIFIDSREEITFVLERIVNAEKDKVIVVIPQNSLLLSSIISLKILQRRVVNSAKTIVLVTEDEYGLEISKKLGLASVSHISEIDQQTWELAAKLKEDASNLIKQRERGLVDGRRVEIAQNTEDSVSKAELVEESLENEMPIDENYGSVEEINNEEEDNTVGPEEDFVDKKQEEVLLERELKRYQKPRRDPKEVSIKGITLLAGGDIRAFNSESKGGTIVATEPTQDMNTDKNDSNEPSERKLREVTEFTGKDFTKVVAKKSSLISGISSFFKFSPKSPRRDIADPSLIKKRRKRRKIFAGSVVILVVGVVFAGWFYLTNVFSSVDVLITFAKEDVSFSEKIIADTAIEEISAQELTIPALLLTEENLNTQLKGNATGEGVRGESAQGFVTIYNTTAVSISIAKNTTIKSVATGLNYKILKDVTIDAASLDENEIEIIGKAEDVAVEAENVGEEYNIDTSDSNTIFEIAGFSGVDEIYAKRFQAFEGGSSETFVAVKQEDVDALKNEGKNKLIEEGTKKLKAFVPAGYLLLEETIEFSEDELRPFPEVGEEAKNSTFDFNISGSVTAIAVKNDDIKDIASILSSSDSAQSLQDYEFQVSEVVRNGAKASFKIDSKGSLSSNKSIEELQELIKGKSINDAQRILSDLEEINEVVIKYSPSFIPESFQSIPNDSGRITIRTE